MPTHESAQGRGSASISGGTHCTHLTCAAPPSTARIVRTGILLALAFTACRGHSPSFLSRSGLPAEVFAAVQSGAQSSHAAEHTLASGVSAEQSGSGQLKPEGGPDADHARVQTGEQPSGGRHCTPSPATQGASSTPPPCSSRAPRRLSLGRPWAAAPTHQRLHVRHTLMQTHSSR